MGEAIDNMWVVVTRRRDEFEVYQFLGEEADKSATAYAQQQKLKYGYILFCGPASEFMARLKQEAPS